jgi:hypothetical protein
MYTHPATAAALAAEHHRTMIAEARCARLTRATRNGGRSRSRWFAPRPQPATPAIRRGLARLLPAR